MQLSLTSFMFLAVTTLTMTACTSPAQQTTAANPDPAHNARNALDWAGAYRGVLPCADCAGIEHVVVLLDDGRYETYSKYLGRDVQVFMERGGFTWNAEGNTVILEGAETARYFVGENRLIRLALDGSRITGPLAEHHVLSRLGQGVSGRYWKLVELNGQTVSALERMPYFILDEDGRVSGFGGCNGFSGGYELDEERARLRFHDLVSTLMGCASGMDVEGELHDVLRRVDNYALADDSLTLHRARMAPLARFEAVYLL